jgi:hypothetical protein
MSNVQLPGRWGRKIIVLKHEDTERAVAESRLTVPDLENKDAERAAAKLGRAIAESKHENTERAVTESGRTVAELKREDGDHEHAVAGLGWIVAESTHAVFVVG